MKIAEIFSKKGEKFFRNLEEKITIKLLESSNSIISLGGGSFVNEKIRKEVITNNFSFWLNWNNSTLLNRIKNSHKRPIAFYSNDQELEELIEKRKKVYSEADFEINCNKLSKAEIVKKIIGKPVQSSLLTISYSHFKKRWKTFSAPNASYSKKY